MRRPILLFDIMETLVTEPFLETLPEFFGLTRKELLEQKHPTSWIEFEEGKIDETEFLSRFFRDGRPVDRASLHHALLDSYDWLDGMQPLVADLSKAGFEMHALSNYSNWYLLIEERLQLSRYLDWSFVSCNLGVRKPDERIFRTVVEQLSVRPEDCIFIDDRPVNVESARDVGLDVVLKQDAGQVRDEFERRKLL